MPLTFDIEQRTERFLDIAREMNAIAEALRVSALVGSKDDTCTRLQALSLRLRDLSTETAATIARVVATGEAAPLVRQTGNDEGKLPIHEVSIVPERIAEGMPGSVLGMVHDVTGQVRKQEAMEEGERRFRTLAGILPHYLARFTPEASITYFNPKLETLLGYRTDDVIGRTQSQIWPDGMFAEFESRILETARLGNETQVEMVMETGDGQQVAHQIHIVAERDSADTVVSVLTVGYDITDRKRIEAEQRAHYEEVLSLNGRLAEKARALDEMRGRLLSVLQTIPDLVWLKDAQGVFLTCNHAFARVNGTRESDIIGKTDYDLFDAERADLFRAQDRAAIAARRPCVNEEWVAHAGDNKPALFEGRKVPVFDADGNVTGVLGVARDITERKHTEEMLATREREFRTLVEHSPDAIVRYGKDLRRLYVNPTAASFVEGGAAELIGKKPFELPGVTFSTDYEQQLAEVFASGKALEFDLLRGVGEAATLTCLQMKLVPEFGAQGEVESVLAVGRDITELHASRQKIHRMAFYDALTSLPNRALFHERLQQMIRDGSGLGQQAGVMMIDMDRFKGINDTMGHSVGDELLREAAGRLSACMRPCDTVARFGGDEFAILLPDIRDHVALEDIARTIIDRFDERFVLNGREVFVSCSIGIALHPVDSVDADDLMKYADSAMYLAKRSGRRSFRFYSRALTVDATEHLLLESELRRAIGRGELELHYQPKVSLRDSAVIGSEALLRWRRPGVGLVPPNQFIPIAEETGLIADLGEWVLREACRTAAEWNAGGAILHKVAVNLSARQFQFRDLARMIEQILDETGCRPEWLELEITESLLLEEDDTVQCTLSVFKSMGLTIAIDDFGTGYSALSYLARFPIDTLKIDRSFIQKVAADRRHAELVKAILSIAHCLGLQVVAEGVETAEQAAFLEANGCHIAQGFLYSKPLSKPDMVSLSRRL